MTDFRTRGTIMGPTGLTAVFGMGTGVAPPVWSPESRPAGDEAGPGETLAVSRSRRPGSPGRGQVLSRSSLDAWRASFQVSHGPRRPPGSPGKVVNGVQTRETFFRNTPPVRPPVAGGGSGWSSGRLLGLVR